MTLRIERCGNAVTLREMWQWRDVKDREMWQRRDVKDGEMWQSRDVMRDVVVP